MNEFELIRRFFTRPVKSAVQGIGDDCARVAVAPGMELAITTDLLIEGRHFLPDADPRKLGWKCLAVNLSDLAAAGAAPRWFTLALALPAIDAQWLERFSEGLFALAEEHSVELIGGDTTRAAQRSFGITALGEVPAGGALSRAGARPGDDIWVSGELGGAALALVHPELPQAARRLHEPQPRVALGLQLRGLASAAMDISDGLAGDLAHILERSGVGARVHYESIPRDASFDGVKSDELRKDCVLSGGDDYELLFTAPQSKRPAIEALDGVTRIGEIVSGHALQIIDKSGKAVKHKGGYDHFA